MAKPAHHHTLKTLSLALATTATLALVPGSAAIAAPLQPTDLASQHATTPPTSSNVAVVVRRGAGVGPRGNAYRYRSATVVRPGGAVVRGGAVVVRPGYGGGVRWARPGWYRWGPGGAIAAGAALGFVAAGAAYAYGSRPRRACAGTIPTRRERRAFGITARSKQGGVLAIRAKGFWPFAFLFRRFHPEERSTWRIMAGAG